MTAGFVVSVNVNGINEVNMRLSGSTARASNLSVPMKRGASLMLASVNENFMSSGRPARWVGLKPSTLSRKIKQGFSASPLLRTGFLRGSITPSVDNTGFKLGTSIKYARIHQKGGFAGRNHAAYIPARPYLVFQKSDVREINKIVKDFIVAGV